MRRCRPQALTLKTACPLVQAEMITANLWRIQPGASEVEVESWETGEPIKLELDPLKTPVEVRGGLCGLGGRG